MLTYVNMIDMLKKIARAFRTFRVKRSEPMHIEFNLTDYCNLNCKGCSHYSPLATEDYEPLSGLGESMRLISEARNSHLISEVYLIGGETLLYPGLKEAMEMARRYFPRAKISIFTNGLLIPRMDREFWDICRRTGCVIALTRYPVKFDYGRVEALCRENGVEVEVFGDRGKEGTFFRMPLDPAKRQNRWLTHFRCISFGCITVERGRIFPCSQSACVGHLNRRFGTDFRHQAGDFIPVSELKDARQLLRLRNRPVPFCGYCRPIEPTPYSSSRRSLSEWVDP